MPQQFNFRSRHAIIVPKEENNKLTIPLSMRGIFLGFETQLLTDNDILHLEQIHLTSNKKWNPYSAAFESNESTFVNNVKLVLCPIRSIAACNSAFDQMINKYCRKEAANSSARTKYTAKFVSQKFGCSHNTSNWTLCVTTQLGIRHILRPQDRRLRTNFLQLKYDRKRLTIYLDAVFPGGQSLRKYLSAQIFTDGCGYNHFYPMCFKSKAGLILAEYIRDNRMIPKFLVTDGAQEKKGSEWSKVRKQFCIGQKFTLPYSPWQNRAERSIKELKKLIQQFRTKAKSPRRLWCFLGKHMARIRRHTAHNNIALAGNVPHTRVHGCMANISVLLQFDWYQPVEVLHPETKEKYMARWLGTAHNVRAPMTWWILPASCRPHAQIGVQALTPEELRSEEYTRKIKELEDAIEAKIGDSRFNNNFEGDHGEFLPCQYQR